eukprot:349476_1
MASKFNSEFDKYKKMKDINISNEVIIHCMQKDEVSKDEIDRFVYYCLHESAVIEDISPEWFIKNPYHVDFWRYTHSKKKIRYWKIYQQLMKSPDYKTPIQLDQEKCLQTNKSRIASIYSENRITSNAKLINILHNEDCQLIKILNVPNEVIYIIASFVPIIIPILYRLSYLPFFNAIDDGLYYHQLKQWWDEVRLSENHRCAFYPKYLKTAAVEFNDFIQNKLAHNGQRDIVYNWRTTTKVPTIKIQNMDKCLPDLGINDPQTFVQQNITIRFPTRLSKNIGGIEMFQRLYLETVIDGKLSLDVDMSKITERSGDNFCFDGYGNVLMANGEYKKICDLKVNDKVRSFPNGIGTIECVIVSNINKNIEMAKLPNNCFITFEHPVLMGVDMNMNMDKYMYIGELNSYDISKMGLFWELPKHIYPMYVRYQDKIYNFILDQHHTLLVNGNWCVTLGHDFKGNVIQHDFWGNSVAIKSFLMSNSTTYPNVEF